VTFPAAPENRFSGRISPGPICSLSTSVWAIQIMVQNGSQEEFRDILGRAEKGRFCSRHNALFESDMTIHIPICVTNPSSRSFGAISGALPCYLKVRPVPVLV